MSGREEEMDEREGVLAAALDQLRGVDIDEAAVRAHVMRPDNLLGVSSDRGCEDVPAEDVTRPPAPVPGPAQAPVVYSFDAAGFIQELEEMLTPNVAGYSIGLTENGSMIAQASRNWAKEPKDGSQAWTPDIRMHIASLSKIVTAIAMTKLLGEAGISAYSPIIDYLPGYWVKGPDVDQITFAELLTHKSGLAFGAMNYRTDFEWMKEQIALGTTPTHLGVFNYQNMNFGLCRILLATINGNVPVNWFLYGSQGGLPTSWIDGTWDSSTISAYASYVASEVFAPSGVTGPDFTHDPADALAYNFPVTSSWNSGNLTTLAGEAGWHMSVNELLKVMGTFRRGGTIVSPDQAQLMLEHQFGIDFEIGTLVGTYYAKVGGIQDNLGHQEQGVAFFLPLNMELVVLVNSPVVQDDPIEDLLYPFVSSAYTYHIEEVAPPNASAPPA
jgi:CubicO group peptidase (beta-lactamase class C family)